jgi:hypothetical protein
MIRINVNNWNDDLPGFCAVKQTTIIPTVIDIIVNKANIRQALIGDRLLLSKWVLWKMNVDSISIKNK